MLLRKVVILLIAMFVTWCSSIILEASLIDNDDGTVTQIRNDGSRLMWLKDANAAITLRFASGAMNWPNANAFIDYLNSNSYLDYNDWRLPATLPVNGTNYNYNISYDGTTDEGWNVTSPNSEMAYMYYVELGNLGSYAPDGTYPQPGRGLYNSGPFINLFSNRYWSGSDYTPNPIQAWDFNFLDGEQSEWFKDGQHYVWAVRSLVVPEPSTLLFLGSGLTSLIILRYKKDT